MEDDDEELVALRNMMTGKLEEFSDVDGQTMTYHELRRLTLDWAVQKSTESMKHSTSTGMDLDTIIKKAQMLMNEAPDNDAMQVDNTDQIAEALMALMHGGGKGKKGKGSVQRYNCGEYGHIARDCSKGKGKGEGEDNAFSSGFKGQGRCKGHQECYNCGKPRHYARDWWAKGGKAGKGRGSQLTAWRRRRT